MVSHYHCWAPTLSQVTHRYGQAFVCPLHLWLPLFYSPENSPWGTSCPRPWSTSNPDDGHRARGPSETKSRPQYYKHVHWADGAGLANSSGVFLWPECRVTKLHSGLFCPQPHPVTMSDPDLRQALFLFPTSGTGGRGVWSRGYTLGTQGLTLVLIYVLLGPHRVYKNYPSAANF